MAPNFGSNLTISGNPAVIDLNGQIAETFDPTKQYYVGDIVRYNGHIYIFNTNHKGAWNPAHATQTDVSTQLSLMPDRIVSEVRSIGYSRTFVQMTDPALDPDNQVRDGDYWIVAESEEEVGAMLWRDVKNSKWSAVRNLTWGILGGYSKMYVRNNGEWMLVYDRSFEPVMYTRIEQTQEKIEMEAVRAVRAEEQLSSRITLTAEQIELEVTRATKAEGQLSSRITMNAESITAEVKRATGAETGLSSRITMNAESIETEVRRASNAEGVLEENVSTIRQTADDILLGVKSVGAVETQGSYILIKNDSITLSTGGKLVCTAAQIQIGTGTLQSELDSKGELQESEQEFYLSTSRTSPTGGNWVTTAPAWTEGKYMWMRTKITTADGTVSYMPDANGTCIAGATGATGPQGPQGGKGDKGDKGDKGNKGDDGDDGRGISSIEVRFKLGTSYTVEPGGAWNTWSTTMPAYEAGKYYWTWTKTTFTDGSVTDLKLSEFGVNAAYDQAASASQLASDIIYGTQKAFYCKEIQNTGVVIDDTSLHVNASGNLYVNAGGAILVRSAQSTSGNPQNAIVINKTGIAVESAGSISIKSGASISIESGGKFTLTSTNFTVTDAGKITCTSGKIGGWDFNNSEMWRDPDNNNWGVLLSTKSYAFVCGINSWDDAYSSAPFYVKQNGEIKATKGTIGGFTITSDSILYGTNINKSMLGMRVVSDAANVVIWSGNDINTDTFDATFYVLGNGELHAKTGVFEGTVYASSLNGQIVTSQITPNNVTYSCLSNGTGSVQAKIDKGVAGKDAYDDLVAGRVTADNINARAMKCDTFNVLKSSSFYQLASWQTKTISGVSIEYLGHA